MKRGHRRLKRGKIEVRVCSVSSFVSTLTYWLLTNILTALYYHCWQVTTETTPATAQRPRLHQELWQRHQRGPSPSSNIALGTAQRWFPILRNASSSTTVPSSTTSFLSTWNSTCRSVSIRGSTMCANRSVRTSGMWTAWARRSQSLLVSRSIYAIFVTTQSLLLSGSMYARFFTTQWLRRSVYVRTYVRLSPTTHCLKLVNIHNLCHDPVITCR